MKFDISEFRPCDDGMFFYDSCTSFRNMWETCQRGDWLLWISSKLGVDKRVLTLAKGKCAETVIHLMKDERSRNAVQAAIDYGNGLISDKQLRDAAVAATAAASTAYASYASYAASAACCLLPAACTDASAAACAARAAACAARAAEDAAGADALKENDITAANICREILTDEVFRILDGRENDINLN